MKIQIILFLLIIIPIAIAEIELKEVFNAEVTNGFNLSIAEKRYYFRIVDVNGYIQIKIESINRSSSTMSFPGQVSFTDDDKEQLCYEACEESEDPCEVACDYTALDEHNFYLLKIRQGPDDEFDIPTQSWPLYATIKIETSAPDITAERIFESTEFFAGEGIRVDVILSNAGSENIIDADYIGEYNENFSIYDCFDCEISGNKITWKGNIVLGKSSKFYYYIKANNKATVNTFAVLTYNDANISLSDTLTAHDPALSIIREIPNDVQLAEEFFITFSLQNNNTEDTITNMKYRIKLPENLDFIFRKGDIEKLGDYYTFQKNIEPTEYSNFTFKLKADKVGEFSIEELIEYKIKGIQNKKTFIHNFSIDIKELRIILDRTNFMPGEKVEIPLKIINPNDNEVFKDIVVNLETDIPLQDKKFLIDELVPHETNEDIKLTFIAPEEKYSIEVFTTYQTFFDQALEKKENFEIITELAEPSSEDSNQIDLINQTLEDLESVENFDVKNIFIFIAIAIIAVVLIFISMGLIKRHREKTIEDKIEQLENE